MAVLYTNGHDKNIGGAEIAANGVVATKGRFVAIKSGYADIAVAADAIRWISTQDKTFDSDNITVKKEKLNFIGLEKEMEVKCTVVWGTIAQANVGSLYDIDINGDVDTAAVTPSQLRLEKVISATEGVFSIAK